MNIQNLVSALSGGKLDCTLAELYGHSEIEILRQKARFINAAEHFSRLYPEHDEIRVFSAPACIVTGGIRKVCTLSVAVSHDIITIAGFNNDRIVRVKTDESELFEFHSDSETDESICNPFIRGMAEQFRKSDFETGGFDLYISSDIPGGCNLSVNGVSDMLISKIIDSYCNNEKTGKKVCSGKRSAGGVVFCNLKHQITEDIGFDFSNTGYSLCVTKTGNTHDFQENYFDISESRHRLYENMPEIRKSYSDEEIINALYFNEENERAVLESDALKMGKLDGFFKLVNESGNSSAFLQQNLSAVLALKLSRYILSGSGAVRIYADTVQAFVPSYNAECYAEEMNRVFGMGSCRIMGIRSAGCIEITGGEL